MDYIEFRRRITEKIPLGTKMQNPRKGDSTITSISDDKIGYRRGRSVFYIAFVDMYDAYVIFKGQTVSSTGLRKYNPGVFDSTQGGHSCNCTFLFMVLERLNIVDRIQGRGVGGYPFYVSIKD